MMIFPLWPFWRYTPWGWCAAAFWNCCELMRVRVPFAPWVFGLIVNRRPAPPRDEGETQ
jgi:hypothetical protein